MQWWRHGRASARPRRPQPRRSLWLTWGATVRTGEWPCPAWACSWRVRASAGPRRLSWRVRPDPRRTCPGYDHDDDHARSVSMSWSWPGYQRPDDFPAGVLRVECSPVLADRLDQPESASSLGLGVGFPPRGHPVVAVPDLHEHPSLVGQAATTGPVVSRLTTARRTCFRLTRAKPLIPLVTSSETTSSAGSASSGSPHSASTSRACPRAHGTAVGITPSSRYDCNGQAETAAVRWWSWRWNQPSTAMRTMIDEHARRTELRRTRPNKPPCRGRQSLGYS